MFVCSLYDEKNWKQTEEGDSLYWWWSLKIRKVELSASDFKWRDCSIIVLGGFAKETTIIW